MIKNYILIACRTLAKHRTLSIINIGGLAIGMTFTLMIGLWIKHEVSFDAFHERATAIGQIMKHVEGNEQKATQTSLPLPLYDELVRSYPELKYITRLDAGKVHNLRVGEKVLMKEGFYADPDFLKMFSFQLKAGSIETALNEPASIVITESVAKMLFQDQDPLGKLITMDVDHELLVTGVLEDVPSNSSLQFNFLVPFELNILSNPAVLRDRSRWQNNFVKTMVAMNEGASMHDFSLKISRLIRSKTENEKEGILFVHPLSKWHLYNEFKDWVNIGGRIDYVRLFGIVGVIVLFIACINFMNLATARSEKRIREVGIRKVIGSSRSQLISQFLGESILTAFIALILSLVLANMIMPFSNELGFGNLTFEPKLLASNGWLAAAMLVASLFIGILAGSYPALYLSSFIPAKALKGIIRANRSAVTTRKILVVTQFTCSITLIISTIVVFKQIQHAKDRPLGYNPENLISLGVSEDLKKNFFALKQDLLATGFVEAVSKSSSPMTGINSYWRGFSWEGKDPNSNVLLSVIMTEYDYEKTSGIRIKAGRAFSPFYSDSSSVMVNESAVKLMGFKQPIGETIELDDQKLTVIGVVGDVVMQDPFNPVRPAIYMFNPERVADISLRLKPRTDTRDALERIKRIVVQHNPNYPFNYTFVDDDFQAKFRLESQVGKISGIFAGLAILISCLGLFGLVTFLSEQRVKEIGVRKVLGASVFSLWKLLSSDFVKLVLISIAIASPIGWYFLEEWLTHYNYRMDLSLWIFVVSGAGALIITVATVTMQAIKAAMVNPVKSLRSE